MVLVVGFFLYTFSATAEINVAKLTALAEQGNLEAQNELGDYYYRENYNYRDIQQAIKWYELAAEQDHSSAVFSLAYLYELAKGVKADADKGESYFLRLGDRRLMDQIILPHLYETGRGRTKNLPHALNLYKLLPEEVSESDVQRVQRKIQFGTAVSDKPIAYLSFDQSLQTPVWRDGADALLDVKNNVLPYSIIGGLIVVMVFLRRRSRPTNNADSHPSVNAAKILIDIGDIGRAKELLLEHLKDYPEDNRAKEVMEQVS